MTPTSTLLEEKTVNSKLFGPFDGEPVSTPPYLSLRSDTAYPVAWTLTCGRIEPTPGTAANVSDFGGLNSRESAARGPL
jgi:hypothetical protein